MSVRAVAQDNLLYVAGSLFFMTHKATCPAVQRVRYISPECTVDVYITADVIRDPLVRTTCLQHATSGSSGSYMWYIFILMNFGVQLLALLQLTYEILALNLCKQID